MSLFYQYKFPKPYTTVTFDRKKRARRMNIEEILNFLHGIREKEIYYLEKY